MWVLLVVLLAVMFAPFTTMISDGGFPDYEYRLRFVDGDGRPIPGVRLRVLTRAGGVSHYYPVTDFTPEATPTSDADGVMIFHHRLDFPLEFSEHVTESLLGVRLSQSGGVPRYNCVFSLGERKVYRIDYRDLRHSETPEQRVKRTMTLPQLDPPRDGETYESRWFRRFDTNGDGQLDYEERIAGGAFEWALRRADDSPPVTEVQIEFPIVERTIVVRTR